MQIAEPRFKAAPASTNWLSTAASYVAVMAVMALFIFFSVDETRALLFG